MAKLSTRQRDNLPGTAFAIGGRKYPIEDENHARNALARVAQHGTAEQKREVRSKVRRRFPAIKQEG